MKTLRRFFLPALLASASLHAADPAAYTRVIYTDDFSSNTFGPRWGHYKSASVVKDGVLVGITAETSDHSAVDHIRFEPEKDLEVSVKFRFVSDKAKGFNVWFDDKEHKASHAGHICQVTVSPTGTTIADAKNGNFRLDLYTKNKAPGGLSKEEKQYIETTRKKLPVTLSLQEWHTLVIRTHGDELEVIFDGKPAGSFKAPGIAHDAKRLVSLTTNRVDVEYDDFSIKATAKP